jgi:hypothetical protein
MSVPAAKASTCLPGVEADPKPGVYRDLGKNIATRGYIRE